VLSIVPVRGLIKIESLKSKIGDDRLLTRKAGSPSSADAAIQEYVLVVVSLFDQDQGGLLILIDDFSLGVTGKWCIFQY
jgi:hypothetical protein